MARVDPCSKQAVIGLHGFIAFTFQILISGAQLIMYGFCLKELESEKNTDRCRITHGYNICLDVLIFKIYRIV